MALSFFNFVTIYALQSRILVLFMQLIFNLLVPDHDANVFKPPNIHPMNIADKAIHFVLGGFWRWDALHFLHIAEYGYTYEHNLAFFPLFPFLLRLLANSLLMPLQFIMNYSSILLVTGFFLNLASFIVAANCLHSLALKILQNPELAEKIVQLFCINPASIFFSAAYTESIFAMLTFGGLLNVESGKYFMASFLFALSGATRSNGFINLAFIAYRQAQTTFIDIANIISQSKTTKSTLTLFGNFSKMILSTVMRGSLCTVIVFAPFAMYQLYTSTVFCDSATTDKDIPGHLIELANAKGYRMPHMGAPVWCKSVLRTSYWHVQASYWQVGFMDYYELKQIPNFLLALPMVVIGCSAVVTYTRQNLRHCLTLGLLPTPAADDAKKTDDPASQDHSSHGYFGKQTYVYIVHMLAMLTFGVFFMNVQVVTRFICSSCPAFYFFVAWTVSDTSNSKEHKSENHESENSSANDKTAVNRQTKDKTTLNSFMDWEDKPVNRAIYVYFLLYFFVGIAGFVNFLPWT